MLYDIMRACERLDPHAVWGRAFFDLSADEQATLLGYHAVRLHEEMRRA